MDRTLDLRSDGERFWQVLAASWRIEARFGRTIVLSDYLRVLDEIKRRFISMGAELTEFQPHDNTVFDIVTLAKKYKARNKDSALLPVAWIEAPKAENASALPDLDANATDDAVNSGWLHALPGLNFQRSRLDEEGAVFVVLAGPSRLRTHILDFAPDYYAVANPKIEVAEAPRALARAPDAINFIHISDLQLASEGGWYSDPVLLALVRDLPRFVSITPSNPRLLFVSGDISAHGKREEFLAAAHFLNQLSTALQIEPNRDLFLVPGNHDIDRSRISKFTANLHRRIFSQDYSRIIADMLEIFESPDALELFGAKMENFAFFSNQLLGPTRSTNVLRPWRTDIRTFETFRIGVASLSSAFFCSSYDTDHRILLWEPWVKQAMQELEGADLTIILAHHPLRCLLEAERSALEQYFREADLFLCGHLSDFQEPCRMYEQNGITTLQAGKMSINSRLPRGCIIGSLDIEKSTLHAHSLRYEDAGGGQWVYHNPVDMPCLQTHTETCNPSEFERHPQSPFFTKALRTVKLRVYAADSTSTTPLGNIIERLRIAGASRFAMALPIELPSLYSDLQFHLEGLFVPQRLKPIWQETSTHEPPIISFDQLVERLATPMDQSPAQRVIILGDPGSGKSTLTRVLAEREARLERGRLPIRISLRAFASQTHFNQLLDFANEDLGTSIGQSLKVDDLRLILQRGNALLLIDGLDEVGEIERRRVIKQEVDELSVAYPSLPIVVTSRRANYADASFHPMAFGHFLLEPFDNAQLEQFVRRWSALFFPPSERSTFVIQLLAAIRSNPAIDELARNPLLATLIALVQRQHAQIPERRSYLYAEILKLLVRTWPAQHGSFFSPLSSTQQEELLPELVLRLVEPDAKGTRLEMLMDRAIVERRAASLLHEREMAWASDEQCLQVAQAWIRYLENGIGLLRSDQRSASEHGNLDRIWFMHYSLFEYLAGLGLLRQALKLGIHNAAIYLSQDKYLSDMWREKLVLALTHPDSRPQLVDSFFEICLHRAQPPTSEIQINNNSTATSWRILLLLLELVRAEADVLPDAFEKLLAALCDNAPDVLYDFWEEPRALLRSIVENGTRWREKCRDWTDSQLAGDCARRRFQGIVALLPGLLPEFRVENPAYAPLLQNIQRNRSWVMDFEEHHVLSSWAWQDPSDRELLDFIGGVRLSSIIWRSLNRLTAHAPQSIDEMLCWINALRKRTHLTHVLVRPAATLHRKKPDEKKLDPVVRFEFGNANSGEEAEAHEDAYVRYFVFAAPSKDKDVPAHANSASQRSSAKSQYYAKRILWNFADRFTEDFTGKYLPSYNRDESTESATLSAHVASGFGLEFGTYLASPFARELGDFLNNFFSSREALKKLNHLDVVRQSLTTGAVQQLMDRLSRSFASRITSSNRLLNDQLSPEMRTLIKDIAEKFRDQIETTKVKIVTFLNPPEPNEPTEETSAPRELAPWLGLASSNDPQKVAKSAYIVLRELLIEAVVGIIMGLVAVQGQHPDPDVPNAPLDWTPAADLALLRLQNRWMCQFIDSILYMIDQRELNADERLTRQTLVLAIAVAQFQTTGRSPWGDRWTALVTLASKPNRKVREMFCEIFLKNPAVYFAFKHAYCLWHAVSRKKDSTNPDVARHFRLAKSAIIGLRAVKPELAEEMMRWPIGPAAPEQLGIFALPPPTNERDVPKQGWFPLPSKRSSPPPCTAT